ncbi:MAG: exodeoxyribonuclease VII small subunit [Deltaproteobacteria bacterium]|nr:exodeoxyribonuclease VII small subunit [Deltaproteobacteria bacterium]
MADQELTVEAALAKLETIAEKLEAESVELDAAVKLYEDGLELYQQIAKKLDATEQRITTLQKALEEQARKRA